MNINELNREITDLHVELSSKCNLSCPQCGRVELRDHLKHRIDRELGLVEFSSLVRPDFIRSLNHLYFCGNYGDPVVAKELPDIIEYVVGVNDSINLGIHTNGSLRTPEWWESLAAIMPRNHYVVFSIDGLEDTNSVYRVGAKWDKIIENASAFINAGGNAHWHYLVFSHNEDQVDEAKDLAHRLGFKQFVRKQTLRPKTTTSPEVKDVVWFNKNQPPEEPDLDKVVCRSLTSKEIFLSADGRFYPCCYIPIARTGSDKQHWDVDYDDRELIANLPVTKVSRMCVKSCSVIDGKDLTRRQFIDPI